uniref:Uncharacterized protein n=1 Tax=Klebsiella pneumoniae TaxID=573 RepID=A0A8B0SRC0_KLEPN|nr:hypothetical protein [Klebsiella pneumoniae]
MVNEDDIRISHKQITLPDTTDTLILVTRIARRSGLKPMLPEAEQFSTVFRLCLKISIKLKVRIMTQSEITVNSFWDWGTSLLTSNGAVIFLCLACGIGSWRCFV